MKQIFDLHMHTINSDGELSVEKLIEEVKISKIKYFSITDHDTVEALKEIKNIDLGNLKFINGVEFSSILDDKYKMHILGYFIDENNEEINNICREIRTNRINRFYELANKLKQKYNISIDKDDLDRVVQNTNTPGQPHLAKLIVDNGYAKNVSEAFKKFLDNIKSNTSYRVDAKKTISAIKNAGGISVLAHPKKIEKKYDISFEDLLPKLIDIGLDGIEIYNSLHTLEECERYKKIANKYNLITSGGSDFHGANMKPNIKIGEIFNSGEKYIIDINEIGILQNIK